MKKLVVLMILFLLAITLMGCSKKALIKEPLSEIDKILIITAMGNPEYGADSKTITDLNEIKLFLDTFNSAKLNGKVNKKDIGIALPSQYSFYSGNDLIAEFNFNGNDTNIIWVDEDYYYVKYDDKLQTPYALYQESSAQEVVVDKDGKEIARPIN